MYKTATCIAFCSLLISCAESGEVAENVIQDEIEDTVFYEEAVTEEYKEKPDLDLTWSLIEGETELGELQTDVSLRMEFPSGIDSVAFFTARGKWFKMAVINNGVQDFPDNCITAIESKTESCFWAIREKEENEYEILFGGIENNKAYAVLNYGYINRLTDEIDYEVGSPEEIETYTQYGTKLY